MFVAAVAGFFRLDEIAELANAGTLLAFIAVGVCMMVLRKQRARPAARVPLPGALCWSARSRSSAASICSSACRGKTLVRFVIWNLIGLAVYFAYSRSRSLAGKDRPVTGI